MATVRAGRERDWGGQGGRNGGGGGGVAETSYHRDDALLYIAYIMLIWAAPIPADRWHCSLWPELTPLVDWHPT